MMDMSYLSQYSSEHESELLTAMWKILRGDELEGVTIRNLLSFLLGIHNLKLKDIIANTEPSKLPTSQNNNMSNLLSPGDSYIDNTKDVSKLENGEISAISPIHDKSDISNVGVFLDKDEKFFFKNYDEQAYITKMFKLFIANKASSAK